MKNEDKTREQLIDELVALRRRNAELETLGTQHNQVAAALGPSTEGWHEAFDAITDIVALISPDLEFIKANKSACNALGMELEELVGKKCYELDQGLDKPIADCPCAQTLETGEARVGEI